MARNFVDAYDMQQGLGETGVLCTRPPLLVVDVFSVGVIRRLIRPEWMEAIAGANSLRDNMVGVLFGAFMDSPTLVEVPIANMH